MKTDRNILVVDDDPTDRMTMVRALETEGFHVESAPTGEEALLVLKAMAFDLVFLDLHMRGIDGVEALRRIKLNWPTLSVIVVTAHGTVKDAVEAMKLGAADFMEKPLTSERIRDLGKSVLAPLPEDAHGAGYDAYLDEARRSIVANAIADAVAYIRKAVGLDPTRPEAFNLLGVAVHLSGQQYEAQNYFRAALALDPTYKPADENLERSVSGALSDPATKLSLGADNQPLEGE